TDSRTPGFLQASRGAEAWRSPGAEARSLNTAPPRNRAVRSVLGHASPKRPSAQALVPGHGLAAELDVQRAVDAEFIDRPRRGACCCASARAPQKQPQACPDIALVIELAALQRLVLQNRKCRRKLRATDAQPGSRGRVTQVLLEMWQSGFSYDLVKTRNERLRGGGTGHRKPQQIRQHNASFRSHRLTLPCET